MVSLIAKVVLTCGKKYRFQLQTGKTVEIVIHGHGPNGNGLDISVDGIKKTYPNLDAALGGAPVGVQEIDTPGEPT